MGTASGIKSFVKVCGADLIGIAELGPVRDRLPDRSACIGQTKSLGLDGHAADMTLNMRHTIRKS